MTKYATPSIGVGKHQTPPLAKSHEDILSLVCVSTNRLTISNSVSLYIIRQHGFYSHNMPHFSHPPVRDVGLAGWIRSNCTGCITRYPFSHFTTVNLCSRRKSVVVGVAAASVAPFPGLVHSFIHSPESHSLLSTNWPFRCLGGYTHRRVIKKSKNETCSLGSSYID